MSFFSSASHRNCIERLLIIFLRLRTGFLFLQYWNVSVLRSEELKAIQDSWKKQCVGITIFEGWCLTKGPLYLRLLFGKSLKKLKNEFHLENHKFRTQIFRYLSRSRPAKKRQLTGSVSYVLTEFHLANIAQDNRYTQNSRKEGWWWLEYSKLESTEFEIYYNVFNQNIQVNQTHYHCWILVMLARYSESIYWEQFAVFL